MDRYELLKFAHIAAAIIWLGGAVMIQFFAVLVRRTGDPLRLVALTRDVEWVGKRVFTPAALAVSRRMEPIRRPRRSGSRGF